jgi:hypothetical protein
LWVFFVLQCRWVLSDRQTGERPSGTEAYLLRADDVGSGKTIEAGLVLHFDLSNRRAFRSRLKAEG